MHETFFGQHSALYRLRVSMVTVIYRQYGLYINFLDVRNVIFCGRCVC